MTYYSHQIIDHQQHHLMQEEHQLFQYDYLNLQVIDCFGVLGLLMIMFYFQTFDINYFINNSFKQSMFGSKLFKSYKQITNASKISRPSVNRKPYKVLSQSDCNYFKSILSPKSIIRDQHELEPFNLSILKTEQGFSKLVLLPKTVDQISKILSYCNQQNLAVVPQGGNTGLVGGNTPVFDEIVLSMKNINKIQKFDPLSSVLTLDAGCILQQANNYVQEFNCEFPLDLGAKGSCHVGGNAATGAGGIYMVKHGSYRSYILGMQVVLPNGQILDMLSQNQKDNTGYDLKQLFIGSQGTLGIITKLNVLCPKFDPNRTVLVFKTNSFQNVIDGVKTIKGKLGNQLNAIEYIDGLTYKISSKFLGIDLMDKVSQQDHLLLVETTSSDLQELLESLHNFSDSIASSNDQQFKRIWKVRQSIALAAQREGRTRAYDISYDIKYWEDLTGELRKKMPDALVLSYGHIGDGNLHLSFCHPEKVTVNDEEMYKMITARKGSISAEHGLGIQKSKYLHLQKSENLVQIYQQIKNVFDPNGILNPYKLIPNK